MFVNNSIIDLIGINILNQMRFVLNILKCIERKNYEK